MLCARVLVCAGAVTCVRRSQATLAWLLSPSRKRQIRGCGFPRRVADCDSRRRISLPVQLWKNIESNCPWIQTYMMDDLTRLTNSANVTKKKKDSNHHQGRPSVPGCFLNRKNPISFETVVIPGSSISRPPPGRAGNAECFLGIFFGVLGTGGARECVILPHLDDVVLAFC